MTIEIKARFSEEEENIIQYFVEFPFDQLVAKKRAALRLIECHKNLIYDVDHEKPEEPSLAVENVIRELPLLHEAINRKTIEGDQNGK